MTVCERCGSSLKNIFTWQGKNYGSECVTIVSGISQRELNQVEAGNVEEYLAKRNEKVSKLIAENEAAQAKIEHYTNVNGWLISFLSQYADPSQRNYNSFAHSMLKELSHKEVKDLSERQFSVLENMWAYGLTGIEEGKARLEFILTSGIESIDSEEAATEGKLLITSYATTKELKELAKENKVKGYSKLKREDLEEAVAGYITL